MINKRVDHVPSPIFALQRGFVNEAGPDFGSSQGGKVSHSGYTCVRVGKNHSASEIFSNLIIESGLVTEYEEGSIIETSPIDNDSDFFWVWLS